MSSVGQVSKVQKHVDGGEHCHANLLWLIAPAPVHFAERENGPNDDSWQVHEEGQEAVRWEELGEGNWEKAGAFAHAQDHHHHGDNEADAVNGHAPLQRRVVVVGDGVADQDENDAGHKGLAHLQDARDRGHVSRHLSRLRLRQAHLAEVDYRRQAGEDRGGDAEAAYLTGQPPLLPEEEQRTDDRSGQAEKGGVAGHGDGEVGPGDWDPGLKAKLLHQQDQQSAGEAECPAEDAPLSHATVEVASVRSHAEGCAGDQQSC